MFVLLAMPLLFACKKNETSGPSTTTNNLNTLAAREDLAVTSSTGPKVNTTLDTQGADKGWCAGWPTNCVFLGGVDIKPSLKISLDAAVTGGPLVVATVFKSADAEILYDYLGSDMIAKLQAGVCFLAKSNDDGATAAYMFGTQFPVSPDNMDLAFQIQVAK